MIDVDATAAAARERRRTWMLGGALLAASALLMLALRNLPFVFGVVSPPDLLFAAGAVVFAFGLGRAGSVVARERLGTTAIVGLAVWLLLVPALLLTLLPTVPPDASDDILFSAMVSVTSEVVALILALIGVTRVGRVAVVPRPWRWAPLWALLVVAGVHVLRSGFLFGQHGLDQEMLVTLDGLGVLLEAVAVGFLGVIAMILAARAAPGSTTVYSSGA
ncbi:hypothetical protein ACFWHT_11105 [Microbacterium sp. NPDC058342]|uniref:hypothetical protein n=1 Tax=Microbacterium sp. NPDC058342 TaxID=3346454 RepID=UPI003666E946